MSKNIKIAIVVALVGTGLILAPTLSNAATSPALGLDLPVIKNPIVNKSKATGIKILQSWVQDNTDPKTGVPIADRLQLKVSNTSSTTITNLEVFYTMTDSVTKASESYYKKLTNFSLPAKRVSYIFFDNVKGVGHFSENKYSIYRNSNNEVR